MSLSTIWALLSSIPAAIKLIGEIVGLINQVRRMFQKDPIEEIRKDEQKQKEAADKADKEDNTDGIFGGQPK